MNRRAVLTLPIAGIAGAALASLPRVASALPFTDIIDVTSYGIIGDGLTDNLAAYQALDAAAVNGLTLHHPPGFYNFSAPFAPVHRLNIVGTGQMSSVIRTTHPTADLLVLTAWGSAIRDIGLSATVTKTAGALMRVSGANQSIENVALDHYYHGFVLNGTTLARLRNAWGTSPTPASVSAGSAFGVVDGTAVAGIVLEQCGCDLGLSSGMPTYGLLVRNCLDLGISNCQFIRHGIDLALTPGSGQGAFSVNAVNSYFDTAYRGVVIWPTSNGVVARSGFTQCWFGGHADAGMVAVQQPGTLINSIRFDGCTAFGNVSAGMSFNGPIDYFAVTGASDLHGNTWGPIYVDAACGPHRKLDYLS